MAPFYIGVGKITHKKPLGKRPLEHLTEAIRYRDHGSKIKGHNLHKIHKIISILRNHASYSVSIEQENLSREKAFSLEKQLILKYGRRDLGTGHLTNLTGGGEGATELSKEVRAAKTKARIGVSTALKGKILGPYSEERKNAARAGIIRSFEEGRLAPKSNLGKSLSEDIKRKISESLKGRPSPVKGMIFPNRKKPEPISELTRLRMSVGQKRRTPVASKNKGRTYEEIYGVEKAKQMREMRALSMKERWITKDMSRDDS